MKSPQLILDAFKSLMAKGMSHAEALAEFDREEFNQIMTAHLEARDGREMLNMAAAASRERMNCRDLEKAIELWKEGWTSESSHPDQDVMSWYWRKPPVGSRKLGRRFLSTDQAWNYYNKHL